MFGGVCGCSPYSFSAAAVCEGLVVAFQCESLPDNQDSTNIPKNLKAPAAEFFHYIGWHC
jgi:hypothetical protein